MQQSAIFLAISLIVSNFVVYNKKYDTMLNLRKILCTVFVTATGVAMATEPIQYSAEALASYGDGDLAPYYMTANRYGKLTQTKNIQLDLGFKRDFDMSKKWSWSYGAEIVTGVASKTHYSYTQFNGTETISFSADERPATIWLQQLYGELKYRSLFLSVGVKDRASGMLNFALSSGDVIQSGNARSIPQVRAGFVDFQDIPLTKHFLQILGEFSYGAMMDKKWYENHFNHYNGHYNADGLYHYKRVYFRTKTSNPFSATFGGQIVCLFGGDTYYYQGGKLVKTMHNKQDLDAFWQALLPRDTGVEGYYQGQSLGSWDINLRYRFKDNTQVKAYVQNLWEDGSGMGKLNGWDGLWGLEYVAPKPGIISGAVAEYIQFTNQGGPMHWDPVDEVGTTLNQYQATGADNYYNNGFYNSYCNYGMSLGTPFSKEPIRNLDGSVSYKHTRVKGYHFGINGDPFEGFSYRVLGSWRKSFGTYNAPLLTPQECTSFMVEARYKIKSVKGLSIKGEFAADFGKLYGDNVGGAVTVSYQGLFNF